MTIFNSRNPAGQAALELGLLTAGIASTFHDALAAGMQAADRARERRAAYQFACDLAEARGRADDNEQTIRTRLGVYREETFPLIEHYGDAIISIKAEGTVEEINARAMEALGK